MEGCYIGSGGFTGEVALTWQDDPPAGELFGAKFVLEEVAIGFRQNSVVRSNLTGRLTLPFFEGEVGVEVGIGSGGDLWVALSSEGSARNLEKPGLFSLELDRMEFEIENGVFTTRISGELKPLFGDLDWPSFTVKELSIDSKGNVHLDGGWLDVTEQRTLDFHGFKIEIAKLGFGKTDDGGQYIGFSGGLKLVDGLQAGASVEGLRIVWYPDGRKSLTLKGAGIEYRIPGVLSSKGSVSYEEQNQRFTGDIKLKLEKPELTIDGKLVIGRATRPEGKFNYFAIYLDADLPSGIPLANTGLAIYGMAGLFALQMEPDKEPEHLWFSLDHNQSWYHSGKEPGVTDITNKWKPHKGSLALGAGLTLATVADNGYAFNGKFLLVLIFPGPILMLQGSANILKKRTDSTEEGLFRSLAVFDGQESSLTIGIDAEYKTGKKGQLIEIAAGTEAFYDFDDPDKWYLNIGRDEPRNLRVRALFGRFVEANAYFMLNSQRLALGAWYGYDRTWKVGPLSIALQAWAEGNVLVSFKPTHFHGAFWLHGLVDLKVFKFGLGLTVDARIAADVFTPFHLLGEFSVELRLPRPLKKVGARVRLEWGIRPDLLPIPLPLQDVSIEHLKTTVAWPLPRKRLLLPNYDDGGGFIGAKDHDHAPLEPIPVVPLDARPHLTFGRPVSDVAKAGTSGHEPEGWETIGFPGGGGSQARARYSLVRVQLAKKAGTAWSVVASAPPSEKHPALFGTWAALPSGSDPEKVPQTKLWLWNLNPFAFLRRSGSSWEEWFAEEFPGYPCVPQLSAAEVCFGFESLAPGTQVTSPWTHPGPPGFSLSWGFGPATVRTVSRPVGGAPRTVNLLCFPERASRKGIRIEPAEPARSFNIVFAREEAPLPAPAAAAVPNVKVIGTIDDVARVCVDFRQRPAGTAENPWTDQGVRFEVRGADGKLLPQGRIERWRPEETVGLNAGSRLDVILPGSVSWVELIVSHRPPFRVLAFNAGGALVATHAPEGSGGGGPETIVLTGEGMSRLEVHAAGNEKLLHRLCFVSPKPAGPSATGLRGDGSLAGPFVPVGTFIPVDIPVDTVLVTSDGVLCLEQICITPDPEADRPVRREEKIQHIREELARWSQEAPVLEPDTEYRLEIETLAELQMPTGSLIKNGLREYAYFRTEGPPGLAALSVPVGAAEETFDSGLDDLTRYVRQTTPPTVPRPGEKPILYRPFYRAYDVGVELNENYVETMYRMDGRDLGLYLYDNNNQPARDADGRLLVLGNRWGRAETLTLAERDTRWVTLINGATCLPEKLDPETFPRDSTLVSSGAGRVLAPDTLYEPRLVPLLLHESFTAGPLGEAPSGWFVEDAGPGGPSSWQVGEIGEPPSRFLEQASAIGGITAPERPGTLLLFSGSSGWTDYRVSVYLRSAGGGAVGVVIRQQGPATGYRFSLDGRVRRLVKLEPPGATLLAEDHFAYRKNRDYLVSFEGLGSSLRVSVDGAPVFDVKDDAFQSGRIGLYTCQSPGARFTDVRVDDFRVTAPVVYRFQLTTSLYANFFHHLHSFQDETWRADLGTGTAVDELLAEAVLPSFSPPEEKEARAYEALAELAVGPAAARQHPARVEATRLERDGAPFGFLVRSPEPFAWDRIELALSGTARRLPAPQPPGAVKLTDATFGAALPADESVTLLLREAADLSRHRVELRALPGVLAEPAGDPVMLLERFEGDPAATRARFTVVDQGTVGGPSDWRVEGGALIQISEIRGGAEPELPGTVALAGDPGWTDYRLTVDLRSDAGSTVGVVFRWVDGDNHYRLSLDAGLRYRRLVKSEKGQISILWEEDKGYAAGEPLRFTVEAVGSRLTGFLGNDRLFEMRDGTHAAGQVGLYACANPDARFEGVEVRRPSLDASALVQDRFAAGDLTGWGRVDEAVGTQPSSWETVGGELRLSSFVQEGGGPAFTGTYAYTGDPGWTDVVYRARLRCPAGGAIGMLFRGRDLRNHYRFSMNAQVPYRQLIKRVNGEVTVLWQDGGSYATDRSHELTVAAVGSSLRGYLDGVPLFVVEDGDIPSGLLALYARSNEPAFFSEVRVFPADRAFAGWRLDESFQALVPGRWHFQDAAQPLPDGWAAENGELRPAGDDPSGLRIAVTGDPAAADYRLAVRLRPGVAGLTGAVFRFLDVNHCFVFLLDPGTGSHRMAKRVAGQETVLWQGTVAVTPGREIGLTFDAVGERLAGWLDGMELFRVDDADLPAGRLGFFVAGSPDTRFTGVRTSEPEWSTWYGFSGEDRRPAGTRVRLHAGPGAGASSAEGNLEHRFAAPLGEAGRLRFPAGGVELRVVGPDGAGHARTFVPPQEHVPLISPGPRVVRRADGTGFVLLPFGGSPLVEGQYRLEFTYHRERPGQVHPFSQAGDRIPERAVLDIPWKAR
ncbi:MAG TPA: hypothetical protein VE685_27280 [Thermoanaerobaculia bacterium]|nr:hypothetical protein [Thermoanaerobaculia bacterium]